MVTFCLRPWVARLQRQAAGSPQASIPPRQVCPSQSWSCSFYFVVHTMDSTPAPALRSLLSLSVHWNVTVLYCVSGRGQGGELRASKEVWTSIAPDNFNSPLYLTSLEAPSSSLLNVDPFLKTAQISPPFSEAFLTNPGDTWHLSSALSPLYSKPRGNDVALFAQTVSLSFLHPQDLADHLASPDAQHHLWDECSMEIRIKNTHRHGFCPCAAFHLHKTDINPIPTSSYNNKVPQRKSADLSWKHSTEGPDTVWKVMEASF